MECWKRIHFIILPLCTAIGVHAGSHTLQNLFNYNLRLVGLPEFSVVGMLDDLQTQYYDSDQRKSESRQQWMAHSFADSYWREQTRTVESVHQQLSSNLAQTLRRFGIQYIQGLWSCSLQNNSLIRIKSDYGEIQCEMTTVRCRGSGFFSMLTVQLQQILNTHITFVHLLHTSCVQHLQKTLQAGKAALERKVAPEVLVFNTNLTGAAPRSLLCLVTPFYPRAVNATWLRDGEPVVDDITVTILPNQDATYRMEILIDLNGNNPKSYTCQVQHSSLPRALAVRAGVGGLSEMISSGPVLGLLAALALMRGMV
ncbi:class I histocompatibility antigen, F10 alpha chain-like [Mustelus asterias]